MTPGIDPEYATIGGLLLDSDQLGTVKPWLRPDDFAKPLCGEIYQLIVDMDARAAPIDPVTVLGELRRGGRLRSDGYPAGELIAMIETVPASTMTPHYAGLVLEASTFRRIERAGTRIAQIGRGNRGTPDDAFTNLASTWHDLADARERWQLNQGSPQPELATTHVRGIDTRSHQVQGRAATGR
jgi:replicative DNA helicase